MSLTSLIRQKDIHTQENGKKRPLGIPSFEDKLVQEVVRMILEAVYEEVFANTSHGFRPNRSCHTALTHIQRHLQVQMVVEGDIKDSSTT